MKTPRLTVIIPTRDPARPLWRTLDSVEAQPLAKGDEVIVAIDSFEAGERQIERMKRLVAEYGPQYRAIAHDQDRHTFGHDQINAAMAQAKGDYFIWCDDDDIFLPGAFEAVREAARALKEPRPLLFGFRANSGIAHDHQRPIVQDQVGGHQLVPPNLPDKLGRWSERYQGDFDFIRSTLDLWGGDDALVRVDYAISAQRPG
jgi:glycosyltransferase involved in cell wall biosynthesis